jgi:hypothetical protein
VVELHLRWVFTPVAQQRLLCLLCARSAAESFSLLHWSLARGEGKHGRSASSTLMPWLYCV